MLDCLGMTFLLDTVAGAEAAGKPVNQEVPEGVNRAGAQRTAQPEGGAIKQDESSLARMLEGF